MHTQSPHRKGSKMENTPAAAPTPLPPPAPAAHQDAGTAARTWKWLLMSAMVPFTKSSRASFCSGSPPTYRACTSARLLMLLTCTQSHEVICEPQRGQTGRDEDQSLPGEIEGCCGSTLNKGQLIWKVLGELRPTELLQQPLLHQ